MTPPDEDADDADAADADDVDELLDGAIVGGDGHHAGQILKASLAVHPHLNILSHGLHILRVPS